MQALTQLYSVLNTLAEQLALAKTEVWVSGCGGRPLLLPGERPEGGQRAPARHAVEARQGRPCMSSCQAVGWTRR